MFTTFDITDCINESADVIITSEPSKSTLSTEMNTITIEVYNSVKKEIVAQLTTRLRQLKCPGIRILEFQSKTELGLTIEVDSAKLTQKIENALKEAGCSTRVVMRP